MIDTTQKTCIYDRVKEFYFVVKASKRSDLSKVQELTASYFSDKQMCYLVIGNEDLREELKDVENVIILTNKSLNLFGKWKDSDEMAFLEHPKEKVVVYFCTENNKFVNKIIKSFQHTTHVGYMNEKLTNFDISFRVDIGKENELLDQITKYLKRL